MNLLAKALNDDIISANRSVYELLSDLGKNLYMPKGIITQGAEAKTKAHKYNATVGIATSKSKPMFLSSMFRWFKDIKPEELFPYAPTAGVPELRKVWKEKMLRDNPSLKNINLSEPVVSAALTHGISLISDMFVDEGDNIILPDMFWGNYRLTFVVRHKAEFVTYPIFNDQNGFNVEGLLQQTKDVITKKGKAIIMLNFPNNPTGYTPTKAEMIKIADGLTDIAKSGGKILAICDDAYFGLYYNDNCYMESIFTLLAERDKNLLAVKLDGPTKENFAWGFRVGFVTFSATNKNTDESKLLKSLEIKLTGLIRGTISNCAHPSQTAVLHAIKSKEFYDERAVCNDIIKSRAVKVQEVLDKNRYCDHFVHYPFNSGYFMCIRLNGVNSEELRLYLLDKYGVGVISTSDKDIRIAFSSVDVEDIEDLFKIIYQACGELKS